MRHTIQGIFRWLNIFAIFALFMAYLSPWTDPARIWFFSFFGIAYSWLLLTNVLFVLIWLILKRWYFLLSLGSILVGWSHLTTYVGINWSSPKFSDSQIKVMSYNVEGLRKLVNKKDANAQQKKRDRFFIWINQTTQPDILCTQESGWRDLIAQNTDLQYQVSNQSVAIFSKYPILKHGKIDFPKVRGNACVWADIQLPHSKIIRVYNTHLQSNRITSDTGHLIEHANLQEKETWLGLRGILSKYKRSAASRTAQARLIAQDMANSPYPTVLCGDFNETPLSHAYHVLATDMQDTFQKSGFGIGTTFSGIIPGLKIDYIFADNTFTPIHHKIWKSQADFSDHYPLESTLVLVKK